MLKGGNDINTSGVRKGHWCEEKEEWLEEEETEWENWGCGTASTPTQHPISNYVKMP